MSRKEALKDLQQRLAERLASARTEAASQSWLAVWVGLSPCLLPLSQSGEIFHPVPLMTVPYVQPWFLGVGNLRGSLFGVVDLARYLQTHEGQFTRNEQAWAQVRLVTLNSALEVNCALLVDRLSGLRRRQAFVDAQTPAADAPACFGQRLTDDTGTCWQELLPQVLARSPGFLAIGMNDSQ